MLKYFLILLVFAPVILNCQQVVNGDTIKNMEVTTNREAQYPEGQTALFQYIYQNIKWPDYHDKVFNQNLSISFDVMPDSSLTNFKILKSVDSEIDNAVLNVFKTIKFAPMIQMGNIVKSNQFMDIPIRKRFE
ncbi:MAG: hypothetical protein Kow0068_24820 [Marinilabiliales bacterium]